MFVRWGHTDKQNNILAKKEFDMYRINDRLSVYIYTKQLSALDLLNQARKLALKLNEVSEYSSLYLSGTMLNGQWCDMTPKMSKSINHTLN